MSLPSIRRRGGGLVPRGIALAALAAVLAACSPIETLRSARGVDKNDPDPNTAPYTESLAKGLDRPYPNLATVPPPPTIASSVSERQKLAETLTAERASAQSPDAQGKPGSPNAGPVPPMPPLPPAVEAPAPPPDAVVAEAAPTPPAGPTSGTGKRPEHTGRKANEPPEVTGPVEALGTAPSIASLPNAEAGRTPPGAARLAALPQGVPNPIPPAAQQSAQPEAPPPVAALPEVKLPPEIAAKPPPKIPVAGRTVAMLDLPAAAAPLGGDDRARLDAVLTAYRQKPATVRVVAYAAPAKGSADQLNSFRAALDRAQSVAKALTDAGLPADKIQTEATPAEAAAPAGRVEVRLLP